MKVINIDAPIVPRKAYVLDPEEEHLLNFTEGVEVLPAEYYNAENGNRFFFRKRHEDGEPGWKGGGFECYDDTGSIRAFYLDALIVHPKFFKKREKAKEKANKPKGKRGRPKLPEGQRKTPTIYTPTGGKRGRPKKDPSLKKTATVYVPTGGKRGRPKKDPSLKKQPTVYVPTGRKKGRPKKKS